MVYRLLLYRWIVCQQIDATVSSPPTVDELLIHDGDRSSFVEYSSGISRQFDEKNYLTNEAFFNRSGFISRPRKFRPFATNRRPHTWSAADPMDEVHHAVRSL